MSVTDSPRRLGDLPDELLIQILAALKQRDLCAMCLVNRRLNSVADPVLYKSILFDQPKHHIAFSESLINRPRRGSLIQNLNVRFEYPSLELADLMRQKDSQDRIDRFSHSISTMSNLENLDIAIPESPLSRRMGTLFNGPFDLACLRSCSLYYQREDGGYWDLQENIHIFSHPTLEILTIRRAKLDQRGFESLEKPSETALKELHLIECDINDDALCDILLLPEALKKITITQLEVPSPELEEAPEDVEDYIIALSSAEHSLESIVIDFASLDAENAMRLRKFDKLKTLEIRDYQLFGQSDGPRLHSVGLPPNLEVLRFLNGLSGDEDFVELFCYTLETTMDILARKMCKIEVVGGEEGVPEKIVEACMESKNFKLHVR